MTEQLPPVTLVLGGARSGKSTYAERLIEATGRGVYIATAEAFDDEMRDRIGTHQQRRGAGWHTLEEPLDLCGALVRASDIGAPVLVDCLTLWLSNLMAADKEIDQEALRLIETLQNLNVPVVMVSNEVGLGIVPDNKLARDFRDHAGLLNQQVAAMADRVVFIAAGLPLTLKE
ncbi:MAG: bifunctional adenosylcobinamide kinase/adenosylcobinamide-phosphate guanylyltransferase [Rhodospirillales bacterium]|nr:bifunctional adenosylcobinamide kinase/adenosylcobinamide-phosphate guanylyltransferase [Rhodospirillales bacterium]MBT4040143.1 bifunctional adenosylcobinamide kinase/adenosylcobinamide-phosphate guanylyltransferase [Rhodospirillales bacterium]MBT4625474.1 bifunctional adenosylcobinamide kinase/adenosylcobinamide-phosphate guanylyltransferase [Rhodospirillales bacterium]MBT5352112.1 bifunctional adenosylcobinamide kinase/adenosylcobinamide-phosphate guanylyltransferase [Rhodospirillales bact